MPFLLDMHFNKKQAHVLHNTVLQTDWKHNHKMFKRLKQLNKKDKLRHKEFLY